MVCKRGIYRKYRYYIRIYQMIGTFGIIFSIILTVYSESYAFSCLPVDEGVWNCPTGNNSGFLVKTIGNNIHIKCQNYPQWPPFYLFNLFLKEHLKVMEISECGLPMNSSISELSSKFNGKNIYNLQLHNWSGAIVRNHLTEFPNLQRFTLSTKDLTNLSTDLFAGVPYLSQFSLKHHKAYLPLGFFNNTRKLRRLHLSGSMMNHLEPGIFDPLTELRVLSWRINNFTDKQLNPGIFDNLASLTRLELKSSNLNTLPENIFAKLGSLQWLVLRNNSFISFPEGILKHNSYLLGIDLSHNTRNISLPQKFFANLIHVKAIGLNHNGWSTIPEDLFWGLISLDYIDLKNNYFETLPKRLFEGLQKLYYVKLNSNRLIILPDRIFSDTIKLRFLNLSDNCLTSISRDLFSNLKSLEDLDLSHNRLKEIEDTSFNSLKNLRSADLSYNQLTLSSSIKNEYGNKSPFHNCTSLNVLNLRNNNISHIFEDWVKDHTQLRILNLRHNEISHISAEDLQFVSDYITVYLQHNKIQHIYMIRAEEIAKYQNKARDVNIFVGSNPIICDCNLYDFVRYLEGKMHPYVRNYFIIYPGYDSICYGPEQMYNVSVHTLKSKSSKYLNSKSHVKQCICREKETHRIFVVDCASKYLVDAEIPWESTLSRTKLLMPELMPCHKQQRSTFDLFNRSFKHVCYLSMNWSLGDYASPNGRQEVKKLLFKPFGNLSTFLTRNHLKGFPHLRKIILSSNGITHLSSDIFADVPHLVVLDLRNNNVRLAPRIFNNTPTLKVLELSNNSINEIESGTFDPLTKLQTLNFSLNNLTQLKSGIFDKLVSLTSLDLSSNNLNSLPENIFAKIENMEVLKLDNNSFNSLPTHLLKQNTKLKRITLCNNRNNITLPETFFGNLTELKELKLEYNGWIMMPKNIFWSLRSLKNISLGRNDFLSLDESVFDQLHHLFELDLSYNKLTTLPDGIFFGMHELIHLNLEGNRIISISGNLFKNLKSLRVLNMGRNQLQVFEDIIPILRESSRAKRIVNYKLFLHLKSGKKADAPVYYSYMHNTHLRILNLSYNNIPQISTRDLIFMQSNITLDLRHNKIQHIQLNTKEETGNYEAIKGHVEILVANNPIICDCNLYDFLYYLDEKVRPAFQQFVHITAENLTCCGPEWTNGTLVNKLQWKTFKCPKSESCPTKCSCWIKPNERLFLIDCSYKNLTAVPTDMNSIPYYRSEINKSIEIPFLTKLRLANNNISDVSVKELSLNVEVLELHNNSIKRLKSDVIQYLRNSTTLKTLTLHGNPWICDCDSKDFVGFVQSQTSKRILNLSMIECRNIKIPILKITMEDLCPNNVIILIVGVSFAVIITALIISTAIALYYRYQREIKVWLYAHEFCLWLVTENELDKNKLYDAFISYSHHDEDFVVNELIKKLEDGPRPFKLCVHFREWLAGEYIPTQIARSVENSRRTIVVLSTNFLNSVWGRMEFKAAHCQALSEGRTRVILILYGEINVTDDFDPDLKAYLNMHTYIKWGDPSFWDKLRYALPHRPELKSNYSFGEIVSETFALDAIRQQ
ncbi:uncharacterized protein LOC143265902 isoform X2 [Megachile rotundata]|uniref:uncharacterized protein LOC143265902 isoform X2 n=1 Tax=Megachile rotundata TaxID=143995 RepID=UPI003FD10E10